MLKAFYLFSYLNFSSLKNSFKQVLRMWHAYYGFANCTRQYQQRVFRHDEWDVALHLKMSAEIH